MSDSGGTRIGTSIASLVIITLLSGMRFASGIRMTITPRHTLIGYYRTAAGWNVSYRLDAERPTIEDLFHTTELPLPLTRDASEPDVLAHLARTFPQAVFYLECVS